MIFFASNCLKILKNKVDLKDKRILAIFSRHLHSGRLNVNPLVVKRFRLEFNNGLLKQKKVEIYVPKRFNDATKNITNKKKHLSNLENTKVDLNSNL